MRFVDEVKITCISGEGGKGCASFRREKFIPYGGPDGGDGGRGGDVILVASERCNTLDHLRGRRVYKAKPGEPGQGQNKNGRKGAFLEVMVPVGTIVMDIESEVQLADLSKVDQRVVLCKGGTGGKGNIHFKTANMRTPTNAGPGGPADEKYVRLELKLIADVGLLGFPNAGKSTLISAVSNARPRVADYPFTTLVPNLGVVSRGWEGSFVIADIPGLVQGASQGVGLGHRFLRHVERCSFFLHLVSVAPWGEPVEDPVERWQMINKELADFSPELAERPQVLALTKIDLVDPELLAETIAAFKAQGIEPMLISSVTNKGLKELMDDCWLRVQALHEPEDEDA